MSDTKCRICNPDLPGEDNICDECKLLIIKLTPIILKAALNAFLKMIELMELEELLKLQVYINTIKKKNESTKEIS